MMRVSDARFHELMTILSPEELDQIEIIEVVTLTLPEIPQCTHSIDDQKFSCDVGGTDQYIFESQDCDEYLVPLCFKTKKGAEAFVREIFGNL